MVWFQMESFPDFIKLWGKIEGPIEPGEYKIKVSPNCKDKITPAFEVKEFDGKKSIYISTANSF